MENKILPLNDEICMTSVSDSILCSILMTNEKTVSWIMNHYIFTWFRKSELFANTYALSLMPLIFCLDFVRDCDYLADQKYTYEEIVSDYHSYVGFLLSGIEEGWYVVSALDQFYLREQDKHFVHTSLIYGANKKKRIFFVRDHFAQGKYSCLSVSFDDMEKSFQSAKAFRLLESDMYLYQSTRYRMKTAEEINEIYSKIGPHTENYKKEIRYALSDMYNSVPIHQKREKHEHIMFCNTAKHGMESYMGIIDYLQQIYAGRESIDFRIFTQIRDHKDLMIRRMEYWIGAGVIRGDAKADWLQGQYEQIAEMARICLSLAIKYNFNHKYDNIDSILIYLQKMMHMEKRILRDMLEIFTDELHES